MPSALFVSPHLDDVAFSCGGTLALLARAGWRTTLCTTFTRSVANPTGFALACQLDKGLGPEADYMALRRAEDAQAGRCLGAHQVVWLDLPEAPHRGYTSVAALFGPLLADDRIDDALHAALTPLTGAHDVVFAPQALGGHVDHRRVRSVVATLARPTAWYRDLPYAMRAAGEETRRNLEELVFALDEAAMAAKLAACAAYTSQIGFQFGDVPAMRAALRSFAMAEGTRKLGRVKPAEVSEAHPDAAALLPATSDVHETPIHPLTRAVGAGG